MTDYPNRKSLNVQVKIHFATVTCISLVKPHTKEYKKAPFHDNDLKWLLLQTVVASFMARLRKVLSSIFVS